MNPQPMPPEIDLDASIRKLKKVNLRLSRILRHLEEVRRDEKKKQKS